MAEPTSCWPMGEDRSGIHFKDATDGRRHVLPSPHRAAGRRWPTAPVPCSSPTCPVMDWPTWCKCDREAFVIGQISAMGNLGNLFTWQRHRSSMAQTSSIRLACACSTWMEREVPISSISGDSVTWYPNQSGNQFGAAQRVTGVPTVTDLDTIDVVDLLGTGTGCLVWSSILPGHAARPVRFVELVGGQRPHQLTVVQNGQGLAARVTYTPSTHLMLNDRAAGHPWVSTFPFSEWVVTELQEEDSISGVRRSSQWSYRHGYYEDAVRETRGFAYVARRDQDHIPDDPEGIVFSSPLPSLETRTWYHTGGYEDEQPSRPVSPKSFSMEIRLIRPGLA